jgi:hypothetical protein
MALNDCIAVSSNIHLRVSDARFTKPDDKIELT